MKSFVLAMLFASTSAIKVEDNSYKSPEGWVNSDPKVDYDRM